MKSVKKMNDKSAWIKIYKHGCKQNPVRGWVRDEYIPGYAPGSYFYTKATVYGFREDFDYDNFREDMTARVRHFALYFTGREVSEVIERPEPYQTEADMLVDVSGNNLMTCYGAYCRYYYDDITHDSLIGVFSTKHKAYEIADLLFSQRRTYVEERKQAIEKAYNEMNIGLVVDGLDDLPFV